MRRKICVVTGTRAEYGLLQGVMEGVRADPALSLQLLVTGMHLSPEFGLTWRQIEADGFRIDRKVEMLVSADTPSAIAKSMGVGLIGFADALQDLQPDLVVLLGDRYEAFAVAAATMAARIPVAHLHGGEATEGLIDEAIRHAITKMSHLHFVAAEPYRQRVIQLGEHPDRVFLVGGLGVDAIENTVPMGREELEQALGFRLGPRNLVVTFHPVTLEKASAETQMRALLDALGALEDTHVVFTMPNADTDGRVLFRMIEAFVESHPQSCARTSLGQRRYYSLLRHVDGVVGNSSSGLCEAPSFKTGTVNIGDRQRGRLRAESVIDCAPTRAAIQQALATLFTSEFRKRLPSVVNPYGQGGASERIVRTIRDVPLEGLLRKRFHDLPGPR